MLRQAYIEGYLDPKEASPDGRWWLKVRWVLDWIERINRNELRKLKHQLNCALLDYFAGDRVVDMHWDQAHSIQSSIKKSLIPWEPVDDRRLTRGQFNELKAMWETKWGKQDDPKTQEEIAKTVEFLDTMNMARKQDARSSK